MTNAKELSPKLFRKMQLTELDMLVDFDRLCRKYNIKYVLFGGSLLGAVRHKGYIPWDDDADIAMLRQDYDKFKKHMHELTPEICYFQDHDTDPGYRWGYGKLRRTNSEYVRVGQEHMKGKTGIFVDVFPMDDVPRTTLGQILQNAHVTLLRKILYSEVGKVNEKGIKKIWFKLISHVNESTVYHQFEKYYRKSRNFSTNRVRCLSFPATGTLYKKNPINTRYSMPKKWFLDRAEYEFEGKKLYSTKDYDDILTYIYGDYMTLPPEEKRVQHSPFSKIVFPDGTNGDDDNED